MALDGDLRAAPPIEAAAAANTIHHSASVPPVTARWITDEMLGAVVDSGVGSGDRGGAGGHDNRDRDDDDDDDTEQTRELELADRARRKNKETPREWFDRMLLERPFVTKSLTTGLTYVAADASAQMVELRREGGSLELKKRATRVCGLFLIGCLYVGPVLTAWFNLLDARVPSLLGRTALDQCVQAPFMIACIFSLASIFEGRAAEVPAKLRSKLKPTWFTAMWVWVPTQLINQGAVPLRYRVVVTNIVSYFWDTYLSLESHRTPAK